MVESRAEAGTDTAKVPVPPIPYRRIAPADGFSRSRSRLSSSPSVAVARHMAEKVEEGAQQSNCALLCKVCSTMMVKTFLVVAERGHCGCHWLSGGAVARTAKAQGRFRCVTKPGSNSIPPSPTKGSWLILSVPPPAARQMWTVRSVVTKSPASSSLAKLGPPSSSDHASNLEVLDCAAAALWPGIEWQWRV